MQGFLGFVRFFLNENCVFFVKNAGDIATKKEADKFWFSGVFMILRILYRISAGFPLRGTPGWLLLTFGQFTSGLSQVTGEV